MKKTDKISYQQKTAAELQKKLLELKKQLVEIRAKHLSGNQKDTSVFKKIKNEIAVISTIIAQNDRK